MTKKLWAQKRMTLLTLAGELTESACCLTDQQLETPCRISAFPGLALTPVLHDCKRFTVFFLHLLYSGKAIISFEREH